MKNVLIIGNADTTYGFNKIIQQDSLKLVKHFYGEKSELTNAFKLFKETSTNCNLFLGNAKTNTSYIDIIEQAQQYDFDYIVPIGVRFSDKLYNKKQETFMSFAEIFLKMLYPFTDSILVMTDNHASLYEDIDHYLEDMKEKIENFKTKNYNLLDYGKQLWLVSNQLIDIPYSNILLTAICCDIDLPNYPIYDIPNSVFDIDTFDIFPYELIYFKNNSLTYNSIENFYNFFNENTAYKFIPIDLVVRRINQELDFSPFIGKLFNNQMRLKITSYLKSYLNSIKGKFIRDYTINNIDYYKENFTYIIVNDFTIFPMNSLEEIKVIIEVSK